MLTPSGTAPAVAFDRRLALSMSRVRLGLAAVGLSALLLSSPGMMSEQSVSLHGDSAKHLMNGVFLADLVRDRPFGGFDELAEYAQLYFARYPALSLGHHPPLVAAAEAPVFALFGVSVAAARMVQLAAFVAAALLLYLLVQERMGWVAGLLAAGFFSTSPTIVVLGRSVMSEMPALALVLAAAYSLHRFTTTGSRVSLIVFVGSAALSLYAKQLAIFVFPAYAAMAVGSLGVRRLLRRDVVVAACALFVLILPLALATLALSPANVRAAVSVLQSRGGTDGPWLTIWHALKGQFAWPVLVLIGLGAVRALVSRQRVPFLFAVWAAGALAGLAAVGPWEPARYGVYAVPALAALAASLAAGWQSRRVALVATIVLALAVGYQTTVAAEQSLPGAGGYEDAARFVVSADPGAAVLFSGDIDTGYFTFFVRKHDESRSLVVLRADKLLTTSYMGNTGFHDRIQDREEIYEQLRRFGVRYVVIEDRPSRATVLEWLRTELRSPRFIERWRMPIGTTDARLAGSDLAVFEYVDASAYDPEAVLSMDLPLIRRSVAVRMSDLVTRRGLR